LFINYGSIYGEVRFNTHFPPLKERAGMLSTGCDYFQQKKNPGAAQRRGF
jgi:hypothetical protein